MRDELWAAERDGPATLNGTEFTAPGRSDLATALVGTGFGYDPAVRAVQAATVARLLPRVRDIRRIGSAAVDLAWTAAGRLDAFYERGINHWDIAAGALICERAGLAVRELRADAAGARRRARRGAGARGRAGGAPAGLSRFPVGCHTP